MSQLHKHIKFQGLNIAPGRFSFDCIVFIQAVLFVLVVVFLLPEVVQAQLENGVLVQTPDLSNFPILSVQVKLPFQPDPKSTDLDVEQFQVFEDDAPVTILSVNQTRPGVHFTLAVNGGVEFDYRDENGISPYNKLTDLLLDWGATRAFAEEDTWSFITNEGVEIRNTASRQAWANALGGYQPNFRTMEPQLSSLETAIALARERVVHFGVDKALLYITRPLTGDQIDPIRALTEAARSAGIHVFVWMIGDAYFLTNDQGGALIDLAERTGGAFFHYTTENEIPNPESYLAPLGKLHTLTYETAVRESGAYTMRVQATLPDGQFSSEPVPFEISLSPPNPILLSPPTMITRQTTATTETPNADFFPDSVDIEIMIEFPDGYSRQITASRLYVDGQVLDVNSTAPFDLLTWDLRTYRSSGEHKLQVEVEDSLGLSGFTILTPIEIRITYPDVEPEIPEHQTGNFLLWGAILTGVALLLIWLIPRFWQFQRVKRFREKVKQEFDAHVKRDLSEAAMDKHIYATLLPLSTAEGDQGAASFPISKTTIVIGRKPDLADFVLDQDGIQEKQAQLYLQNETFWLRNLNSGGRTWVNYELIGSKSVKLQPGDLLHFGTSGFRFTIIDDNSAPAVVVTKYEPLL